MIRRLFVLVWLLLIPAGACASSSYYTDGSGKLQTTNIAPKTVVLTFDDGPSEYTESILQILRQYKIHATFFVVGREAVKRPMLREIYQDGNEIGNHTYSHPNLASLPDWQVRLELGLDRLIIESQTGHGSRIFRPPFLGSDTLNASNTSLMNTVGSYGYLTEGEDIDSEDWRKPGVAKIVSNAASKPGGIVLLHDGGGDRSETVKALPEIIEYYRIMGYSFSTVSEALHLTRESVMPITSGGDRALVPIASVVFSSQHWVELISQILIWILIVVSFVRIAFVMISAYVQSRLSKTYHNSSIPCSVIVPAYNEEAGIVSCLLSVLASDYPQYEVIVVDDGSKDNTVSLAGSISNNRLRILTKPNGGKASALNFGIAQARAGIVIAIDADTVFQPDTLSKLMRHFADTNVGAVSGNTRIANRNHLITKLQSLEYVVGFNLDRRMGDLFDCITVVPGAIGAFRTSALHEAGGFTYDTLAEDTDVTLHIKELGYRIVYDSEAIAYTEAPSSVRDLLKQRFRWTFGTMQAVWKHRKTMLNPRFGTLGLIGLPYLVFFQILFPLIAPAFDISLIIGIIGHHYGFVLLSLGIYSAADILMAAMALVLDGESVASLWLLIPQRIYYRQLMYYVIIKSAINVLRGNLVGWGTLKRQGSAGSGVNS